MPRFALHPLASLVCLLLAVACDDAPAASADPSGASGQTGSSGSAGSAGSSVEPTPPAPPVLTPCPERWTEKTLPSGVVACEPGPLPDWTCPPGWLPKAMLEGTPRQYNICEPPPLPESCPEGTMAVLGESACQPIGDPCPAGDFPEGLPSDKPILYVKAGASGGDGSQGKPFATIGEAVQKAGKGTVVAIAKGLYPEAVSVGAGKDVTLWGACVTGVTIQGPAGNLPEGTLVAFGSQFNKSKLSLKNVSVTGKRPGIVFIHATGEVNGVQVKATYGFAIFTEASTVGVRTVLVRDTQSAPDTKNFGRGLSCEWGAQVTVERTLFDHNRDVGILAYKSGTSLTLSDSIIRNTQGRESDKNFGLGLSCEEGAKATIKRVLLDRNHAAGIFAYKPGTSLTLSDSIIRNTQGRESDKNLGEGLKCQEGAEVTVERSLFDHNHYVGVINQDTGSLLSMIDSVVRSTQSNENDKQFGRGLSCHEGSTTKIERSLFDHNREISVFVSQDGTSLTLNDSLIQHTQSRESDNTLGEGLSCSGGAKVVVDRSTFDHNREVGILASDPGTSLTLSRSVVKDTQNQESDLNFGDGIGCQLGASVKVNQSIFDFNHTSGVFALREGTSLKIADSIISNTQSQASDKNFGQGLACQGGAAVSIERTIFERNHSTGVLAMNPTTLLTLTDTVVQETQSQESNGEFGVGVALALQASLKMERVVLRSNRVASLLLLQGSKANLSSVQFASTLPGDFTPVDALGSFVKTPIRGVGDGLVVLQGSSVTATDLLSSGHQRAGLLFVDSTGTLTTTTSTGNQYGLVLRGSSQPSHDETCSFEGNQTPILPDGDLPVPNAPLQIPPSLD